MATGETRPASVDVINPLTGGTIGSVPNSTPEQVRAAVERARAAQPKWVARGALGRARYLRLWAEELWRDRDRLAQIIREETGKPETGAIIEIIVLDLVLDYYAKHAPRILKPHRRRTLVPLAQYARIYYKPFGVVGALTPWNYPYLNAFLDVAPALVAGNTVVLKPSEVTPFTAIRAVELAYRAGMPPDVLQVITGDGDTGAALVNEVDFIHLTGSTATGRKVAVRAAERLIPTSLELGGKDATIVLDDADPDQVALGVIQAALENAGQTCVSIERVYVLDAIYDRFIERLVFHLRRLNLGAGSGMDVHVGSMTNERELLRCEAQIADAVAKGARVLLGGRRRPDLGPLFFEPTILVDVDHSMDVMCEETFGPLIPVMRVHDVEEAVRLTNDSSYGLSSSIFSLNLKRAEQIARQLDAGDTSINRAQWVFSSPTLPMGGRRNSGIGRRGGPEGLLRFVSTQAVLVDRGWIVNRTLTQLDPLLYRMIMLTRPLRRWLPFVRP